jgi:PKD repeat protein
MRPNTEKLAVAVLLLLVSVSGIIAVSAATTTAEQEDLVYLNDDRDVLIPEYQVSTTEVADTGTIQVEFLLQNTSRTTQSGSIDFIFNSAGSTVEVMPDSPQDTIDYTLEPGERQEFTVDIKFNSSVGGTPIGFRETGPLQIVDTTRSVSPQQISNITVLPYSSSVGSGTISPEGEPEQVTKSFSSFTDDGPTSVANFSDDIPPLSQANNEYTQDSLGRVLDFNNSRSPQNDGMVLRADSNGDLRTGVSVENVPDSEYYQLQFNYIIPGSMDGISVRLVDSTGEEIDEDTSYNLANQPDRRSQYITLSQAEAEYIRSSKQINVVFESYDNNANAEAEIYFTQLISSESAISTASADIIVEEQKIVTYEEWSQFRNLGRTEANWDAVTAENQFARNQQYVVAWKATNQGSSFGEQRIELNENGSIVDFVTVSLNPSETEYIGTVISRQEPREYVYQSSGTEAVPAESIFVGTNIEADPIAQIDKSGSDFVNGSYIADPAGDTIDISASKSFGTTGSDIVSYEWTTDGLGSYSGENISIPVNSQGSFDVVLTVTDEDGKTDTDAVTIEAGTIPPEAETLPDISRNAGETILFSAENSSHPDPNKDESDLSYEWEVLDESSFSVQTGRTQSYLFTEPGEYEVQLTVTDDNGNTDTDTRTVQIGEPRVNAFIDISTSQPIANETEVTIDASDSYSEVGSINEYRFNFGDGSSDRITDSATVNHTFSSSGERVVKVTVENELGNTDSAEVIVDVQNDPFDLQISGASEGTTGTTFNFSAQDSRDLYNADSLTWEIGDGTQYQDASTVTHSYDETGSYTVTLTGTDEETGFTDTATTVVDVGYSDPNAVLTSPLEEGQEVNVSDLTRFSGEESSDPDGTELSYEFSIEGADTDQNLCQDARFESCTQPSNDSIRDYQFPSEGEQTIVLTVTDSTPEENTDTDRLTVDVINRGVVFNAYANDNDMNLTDEMTTYISDPIVFDSSESFHVENLDYTTEWNLGDGNTVSGENFEYTWDEPGLYNVTGTMTGELGKSASQSVEVLVETRQPNANFEVANPNEETQVIEFNNLTTHNEPIGEIVSYEWDFGDGSTSTNANPSHNYRSAGQYNVTLTVEDQWGQTDTYNQTVTVTDTGLNIPQSGLELLYTYEGGGQQVEDQSRNNNDASSQGGNVSYLTDNGGRVLSLNGSNYLQTPNDSSLQFGTGGFTVSTWVRYPDNEGDQAFLDKYGGDGDDGWMFKERNGSIAQLTVENGDWEQSFVGNANTDTWKHVLAVRNSDGSKELWIDGDKIREYNTAMDNVNDTKDLRIGKSWYGSNIHGEFDDTAIYSRSLSRQDINELYNNSGPRGNVEPPETVYTENFSSGNTDGWSTPTNSVTTRNGWLGTQCSTTTTTNEIRKNLNVGSPDVIQYDADVAAVDSWDGESLRLQFKDDSGWNTVESENPQWDTDSDGSDTEYDCRNGNWGSVEYDWTGTFNVDGTLDAVRVLGNKDQNDEDESIAIDSLEITE